MEIRFIRVLGPAWRKYHHAAGINQAYGSKTGAITTPIAGNAYRLVAALNGDRFHQPLSRGKGSASKQFIAEDSSKTSSCISNAGALYQWS